MSPRVPVTGRAILFPVLAAGLLVGILDGTDAVLFSWLAKGVPPFRVFQYIASGALGVDAFRLGMSSATLGVVFHLVIATSWTLIYFLASRKFVTLIVHPVIWGTTFGLLVFLTMRYGVVPLSAAKQAALTLSQLANLVFAHIFCVGLPIAFMTRRWSSKGTGDPT